MAEGDLKRAQSELETATKIIRTLENEVKVNKQTFQKVEAEIKDLKEKLKGNISLIKAKYIIWREIISEMKSNWNFLNIVAKEKSLISEHEKEILSDKQTSIKRENWARKFLNFINSK